METEPTLKNGIIIKQKWRLRNKKMKKIMTIFGAMLIVATILTSCGGGNDKVSLILDNVTITGDSKDYIEVVPGTYEVKKIKGTLGEELQLSLKFKVTNSYDQNKIDEYTSIGSLSLQITDQSGTPIDFNFSPAGVSDWDKIKSLLKGQPGDEVTVLFKPSGFPNEEKILEVLKNGKGIEITRADITNPKTEPIIDNSTSSSDESDDDNSTSSSDASGDCDQFCSDYESFANEYVDLMKKYKANPSDASILSEYTEIVSKAADMQESSKDCTADAKFAARISKAVAKIAKAAM